MIPRDILMIENSGTTSEAERNTQIHNFDDNI